MEDIVGHAATSYGCLLKAEQEQSIALFLEARMSLCLYYHFIFQLRKAR